MIFRYSVTNDRFSPFYDTRGAKNVTPIADATEESSIVSGLNIAENTAGESGNCIRCAEQAGRNESAVVARVLNQTRNIPRRERARARTSARTRNTIARRGGSR